MSDTQSGHLTTFQQHRPLLFSLAYRMLGSVTEAEDILQDAYLRFQPVPLSEVESPKAYLSAIVTRLCLNHLTSARVRRETYVGPWLPEPVLSTDYPELTSPEAQASNSDSVSLAFLRARFQVSPEEHRRFLEEFIRASAGGDLDGLMTLLTEDVTFWADGGGKVRGAALQPVRGRADVARFVIGVTTRFTPPGAQFAVADVNGKPTLLIRHSDGTPAIVVSIEVDHGRIRNIWAIANPDKLGAV